MGIFLFLLNPSVVLGYNSLSGEYDVYVYKLNITYSACIVILVVFSEWSIKHPRCSRET